VARCKKMMQGLNSMVSCACCGGVCNTMVFQHPAPYRSVVPCFCEWGADMHSLLTVCSVSWLVFCQLFCEVSWLLSVSGTWFVLCANIISIIREVGHGIASIQGSMIVHMHAAR
jgi:hypothetical protein